MRRTRWARLWETLWRSYRGAGGLRPIPTIALLAVLLAAATHATWNLFAKKAAASRHFVWLYSLGSVVLYCPFVIWICIQQRPHFQSHQYLALAATSVLHLGYSLSLQAGYRTSDLSLVYPIARGFGPLLSFVGAVLLLGEQPTVLSAVGLVLIVAGIALVAGLTREPHRAPRKGIFFGLLTGLFIASYTLNDGWAVKVLALSPFIVDFTGNCLRILVLTPIAWRDKAAAMRERSEEHTSELQSLRHLVCRLLLEKKKLKPTRPNRFLMAGRTGVR